MILFGQARPSTCSIIYNAKDDGWFSLSQILPSTSALDSKLAAILVQSCRMFLLDSAHKHDALVPIWTNNDTLQLAAPKQRQQHSCLKGLLEAN